MASSTRIHWFELGVASVLELMFLVLLLPGILWAGNRTMKIYNKLNYRPGWAPAAVVFGIAWVIVVVCMAAAYTLVRLQGEWEAGVNLAALVLFALTLIPLIIWTAVFQRSLGWSTFVVLIALVLAIITTWLFFTIDRHHHHGGGGGGGGDGDSRTFAIAAGILLLPLDLWLLFALILSTVLWWSNWDFDSSATCKRIRFEESGNAQRQFN
jgi:tryptophan-rich sensory protein